MTTTTDPGLDSPAAVERFRPISAQLRSSKLVVQLCRLVLLALVLGSWQLAADSGIVDKAFSSSPTQVWHALVSYAQSGKMVTSTASTLEATVVAFVLGVAVGVLAGFVLGLSPFLDSVLGVFVVPLNSIPRIALAPLFLVWFGLSQTSKIALAFTIVVFVMFVNARSAVKNLDPDLVMMARVAGLKRRAFLAKVLWPSAVPTVFAGVRLSLTYALLGVIASEMISARSGLGIDITTFSNTFDIGAVFAVLLELSVIATVVNVGLEWLERWLLRWQRSGT